MKRNFLKTTAAVFLAAASLAACGGGQSESTQAAGTEQSQSGQAAEAESAEEQAEASGEVVQIDFWSAPQVSQQAFWESIAGVTVFRSRYSVRNCQRNCTRGQ